MTPTADAPLSGKVAVVTGSNTGIGRATATELARRGASVVLACRSEEKTLPVLEHIAGVSGNQRVSWLRLDLGSLDAVRSAAHELLTRDEPIHLLVNNAGLAGVRGQTADGFELAFGTNHLAHFLFTNLLLERMRSSGPARVVNVSSDSHFQPKKLDFDLVQQPTRTVTGLREYGVSKLCNVLFTQELARREDPATVATFAVHPGVIASDIWQRRAPKPIATLVTKLARMKSTEQGSTSSLFAATEPGIEDRSGSYVDADCTFRDPNPIATPELSRELWDRSVAWTRLVPG